ncbi:MAG: UvrD-helicase domain-containing protein [Gammaproteobacteria bacterium]|nr:UvrD-helicase domain-containing protein [Gammaproteobacteria bacterium]
MADIDHSRIADKDAREEALIPDQSFIVQAPAGSGKTELLTQRYLALLARVENPEEILAVTFTRKAAAEMRNRIIDAIQPSRAHKDERLARTKELADAVLERDQQFGWQLTQYPARLRIRTIDSVNAWLSATAPLAGKGRAQIISETPNVLYRQAATRVVERAARRDGAAIRTLLMHLDNRSDFLVGLIAGMLSKRDQWFDIVNIVRKVDEGAGRAREALENILHELVARELISAAACLSVEQRNEVFELMQFAAGNIVGTKPESEWAKVLELDTLPGPEPEQLEFWKLVADFLLTTKDDVRKTVNKNNGFPAGAGPQKILKDRALGLLTELRENHNFGVGLGAVRALPAPRYSDDQWHVLGALLEVLNHAVVALQDVFAESGEADYPAIAKAAIDALVEDGDVPTDLALRLDYRIGHILIDEFQDTSSAQMELLKALTAGWEDGDGRTLFVVGDPMQSIYRFRKAEVGLFIELQNDGLSNLHLRRITLTTNFRSDPRVVDWANSVFESVMPPEDDPVNGAVSYTESVAARMEDEFAAVREHALLKPSRVEEAGQIIQQVKDTLAEWPEETIGILVRSRKHAELVVDGLQEAGIDFSGTGLENSLEKAPVQDLLCITRALTHRADRTAWLGLLRAPWCGLGLADIERLVSDDMKTCVWDLMIDPLAQEKLSADGKQRLQRVVNVLTPVFARRGSLPLRDVVEGVWVELGGPAFLTEPTGAQGAYNDSAPAQRAAAFFAGLDQFDDGGDCADAFNLHELIQDKLKIDDRQARVNVMTIHKAKGLEFDTVILPALEAVIPGADKPALAWQEVVWSGEQRGIVIAPVERTGDDKDPIYDLARRLDAAKGSFERDRLLYVATTRARKRLHLYFGLAVDEDSVVKAPAKNSLLARLWPVIGAGHTSFEGAAIAETNTDEWQQPRIRRYDDGWTVPVAPLAFQPAASLEPDERMRDVTYDWASPLAQHVGTVVHSWLEKITCEGVDAYDADRIGELKPVFRHMLLTEDTETADLERGVDMVSAAILNTLDDEMGRWLLTDSHPESACELPVTGVFNRQVKSHVIDRTFLDDKGIRWIIDYKTSPHEGGGLENFLNSQEERYRKQLRGYRDVMQLLEPEREIRTALYFPLLSELRIVEPD